MKTLGHQIAEHGDAISVMLADGSTAMVHRSAVNPHELVFTLRDASTGAVQHIYITPDRLEMQLEVLRRAEDVVGKTKPRRAGWLARLFW